MWLICAMIGVVTAALATLINRLSRELEPLLESDDNWQLAVHGGRSGDVVVEVKRTCQVLGPRTKTQKCDSSRN